MRAEYPIPQVEGVYGPEIIINTRTGVGCLRLVDGTVTEGLPARPHTNAFVVWLGHPIAVVSEGVERADVPVVVAAVRALLESPTLPVVFTSSGVRVSSNTTGSGDPRELARAAAYVRVQAAWEEEARFGVELDGRLHAFRMDFVPTNAGALHPRIR